MTQEITCKAKSGWLMLIVNLVIYGWAIWFFVRGILTAVNHGNPLWLFVSAGVCILIGIFLSVGLFILQPNQAGALVLFGSYQGTVKDNGFWWRNPFTTVNKISLRARNLNGEKLKVNDQNGNPIEIAAVVVWKVENTAEALFDVDDYEEYVDTQSEAAIRHLAGRYPYDTSEDENLVSLRQGTEEVNHELQKELQERLGRAGVRVIEARISHLAYASEIAGAMLRRQQAQAIIAARKKIVEGAVSMVEMALHELSEKHVVELDEERKAAMVSNLLVVLCSEESAQPVVNTGTLYS
ncbi:MAG: SPFH domain-containing protein [Candidatus Omnitrophota bacterium]|jgi:regulator of protease activity HflC (stomatin/prohibitin superfamily)|nr:MAG: SPFH domain-containing protein [Candidatus Omnitrophota bacterium]